MADDTTTPSGGRTASEFRDIADALRSRVDLFGKTLAAVATLGTTAVGLNKIGDLLPAEGNSGWVVAACGGLGVAALAAIGVAVRLMLVGRPIFMQADLKDLDSKEAGLVKPVFSAAAARFGHTSLTGLQERERSLRTAASRATDTEDRLRRTALADQVKAEIEQALARGQLVVVRRRATQAVSDVGTWSLYLAVIGGLVVFALATDAVSSARTNAKACGEARKAGATAGELGRASDACDGEAEKTEKPQPPSAPEARAQITAKLAAALEACTALIKDDTDAKRRPLKTKDCDPVRAAVAAMDPPP
jgi:hypothetical protein